MRRQTIEHNFSKDQLKNILRDLNKQLGVLEREGSHKEVREKILDIRHYESMWYKMAGWSEYIEFDEELSEIRSGLL